MRLAAALIAALIPAGLAAQSAQTPVQRAAGCYRFAKAELPWGGRKTLQFDTVVVRLDTSLVEPDEEGKTHGMRRLSPVVLAGVGPWGLFPSWTLKSDSLEAVWSSGWDWVEIHLTLRGNAVRGTAMYGTDAIGGEVTVPIRGVRAECTVAVLRSSDDQLIRHARGRSNAAIAHHDTLGLAGVFLPEYLSISSTNARSIGRDSARARYAQLFAARPDVVFVRTPDSITVNRSWGQASESGHWTGTWTQADGVTHVGGTYFAKWLKRDERWALLSEVFVQTSCSGSSYCSRPP